MTSLKSTWRNYLIILGVFILALIPRVIGLGTFWGTDERYHWQLSNEFLLALLHRDWAGTVPQGLPGLTLAWIDSIAMLLRYGLAWLVTGGQTSLEQIMAPDRPFAQLAQRQLAVVLVNTLLVVGLYLLARRIFGAGAALLGVTLIALDPFFLAESRVMRFEALVAGLMPLALLAALLYLKEEITPSNSGGLRGGKLLVLSAVLTALAMLTKISAVFLLPVIGLLGAATLLSLNSKILPGKANEPVLPAHPSRPNFPNPHSPLSPAPPPETVPPSQFNAQPPSETIRPTGPVGSPSAPPALRVRHSSFIIHHSPFTISSLALAYLLWIALALFFFWLFWPAMWVAPLKTLQEVGQFVESAGDEGFAGRGVFFWGMVYPDDPGYWFYPVTLLFRLTPLTLGGVSIAGLMLLATFKPGWSLREASGWQSLGLAWLLIYALLFVLMMTLGAKKYDRYLMPIFPALDLAAGLGWLWLGQVVVERWFGSKWTGLTLSLGWPVLLALQCLTTLPHLPYFYTYYNPLLGGVRAAVNYVPVGYAEGLEQVAAYLEQKPNAAELKVASGNSSKLNGLFSGQTIALANLDGKWIQADYVLIYISQLQRGKHAQDILDYLARREPEYRLVLHGLEYAWLYPGPAAQYYGGGYKLEGRGTLFGYDLNKTELAAGETLEATLYWRNEGQRPDDRFFVRLMDLDGYVWAEAIAQPRPGFEEANRRENSIMESQASLTLPAGMPPGDYFFKPGFRTDSGEIIGYFELPGHTKPLQVTTATAYPPAETFHPPYPARLSADDQVTLLGYDLEPGPARPDSSVWLTLYWQALTDVTHDYVILLRLLDSSQTELVYWLGRPVRSGYPTTEWRAGQIVQDPWLLTIPQAARPGAYQLEIAIFDAETQAEVDRQAVGQIQVNPRE